jgi:DNA-binding SARP family transcriptional activator
MNVERGQFDGDDRIRPGEVVRIHLLGEFLICIGDHRITSDQFRLVKSRSLIKLLALAPNHKIHREQLMEFLWPDHDPRAAANNLHQLIYAARRVLNLSGDVAQGMISFKEDFLCLCPDRPVWIDVEAFESAAVRAHLHRQPEAYREALALYTGELLPEDRYEDWASSRRESLGQACLRLWLELACLEESTQNFRAVIEALQQALVVDPALKKLILA